jgi:LuxR family maltose regulon positive regulatory protein
VLSRPGLVNRLRAERATLVVAVAPAGYGKTTLLAQWAERDERAARWLSLDSHDNEPRALVRHLAAAFDLLAPLDRATVAAVAGEQPLWSHALPRLLGEVAGCERPFVFVLDNCDALRRGEPADILLELAKNIPDGSVLALAGRSAPPLPLGRLRLTGRLLELETDDLALTSREAKVLAAVDGPSSRSGSVSELVETMEGWAAGIRLATLARSGDGSDAVGDYLRAEHLDGLTKARRTFLRRTSILTAMCGPLCDAVLASSGSTRQLDALYRANVFTRPIERATGWWRYHRVFREVLRAELEREEPELVSALHERAAEWFEQQGGDQAAALEHALAAGDVTRACRLFAPTAFAAWNDGRLGVVERWLEQLDAHGVERQPAVAAAGAWFFALLGRAADAERWHGYAAARAPAAVRPVVALVQAALCAHGVAGMRRDVHAALAGLRPDSPWWPVALLLEAELSLVAGETGVAEQRFAATAEKAEASGAVVVRAIALAQASLLAEAEGRHREGEGLALQAREALDAGAVGDYATSALVRAAAGRVLLRNGRWDDARRELTAAEETVGGLTHALPWLTIETRLALARAFVTLRDAECALVHVSAVDELLTRRPHLGAHRGEVDEVRTAVDELPGAQNGHVTGLTAAELRLFPLLATHLSFREIGEQLFVSRNTIKTQAISAYRKLGVSSRSAAIARAAELGLVDLGRTDLP